MASFENFTDYLLHNVTDKCLKELNIQGFKVFHKNKIFYLENFPIIYYMVHHSNTQPSK